MKHPPQSPDMNPIELLWDELDRKLRTDPPTSRRDLLKKYKFIGAKLHQKQLKN